MGADAVVRGSDVAVRVLVEPTEFENGRGAACCETIDDAIPPVAAKKPSGISECPKDWETRRKRPLSEDDAARRLSETLLDLEV